MTHPTFEAVRTTLDMMADRHSCGIKDEFSCPPACAQFAKAVVDSIEARGGQCPLLIGEERGVSLTFSVGHRKVYYLICEDEVDVFSILTGSAYFTEGHP